MPRWNPTAAVLVAVALAGTEWGTAGPAVVDFDGDGDTDLVSKVWNSGGRPYHADLWRNDNSDCSASGGGVGAGGGRAE